VCINFDQPSVLQAFDQFFFPVVSANLRRVSSFEALLSSTKYELASIELLYSIDFFFFLVFSFM
jgi:hypothetical protein